jgi:hypothetical protein
MDKREQALLSLGQDLKASNYCFTTITPNSHHRVNARKDSNASPLERVFGWAKRPIDRTAPRPLPAL